MITRLVQYLATLIHTENETLRGMEMNKKELMATNSFGSLPEKVLIPLMVRDALQKVVNYINFTQPAMRDPNSTNLQKMEELLYNFTDDYMKWATENEKDFPIIQMVEGFPNLSESTKAELRAMSKHEIFTFLTTHMIHQYADDNQAPEPEDNEPEVA